MKDWRVLVFRGEVSFFCIKMGKIFPNREYKEGKEVLNRRSLEKKLSFFQGFKYHDFSQ